MTFDHIISTVNSINLSKLYPPLEYDIEHKTMISVNLGYNSKPSMTGYGYSIPAIENQKINYVTYNYNIFPKDKPYLTIFGKGNPDELIKDFQIHTNYTKDPRFIQINTLPDAIPQFHVGHYLKQLSMLQNKPEWLHIAGQSFFPGGIISNILRSKNIVDSIDEKIYAGRLIK